MDFDMESWQTAFLISLTAITTDHKWIILALEAGGGGVGGGGVNPTENIYFAITCVSCGQDKVNVTPIYMHIKIPKPSGSLLFFHQTFIWWFFTVVFRKSSNLSPLRTSITNRDTLFNLKHAKFPKSVSRAPYGQSPAFVGQMANGGDP